MANKIFVIKQSYCRFDVEDSEVIEAVLSGSRKHDIEKLRLEMSNWIVTDYNQKKLDWSNAPKPVSGRKKKFKYMSKTFTEWLIEVKGMKKLEFQEYRE